MKTENALFLILRVMGLGRSGRKQRKRERQAPTPTHPSRKER